MGGTSGIGAAIAERFARDGDEVTAAGLGAVAPAAEVDVTEPGRVAAFFDGLDTLDVLVNAAGVLSRDDEHRPEVFERVLAVNLTGTMRTCAAARELLAASGGCVVNIASMLSFFGGPRVPAYSASKGGVVQLTKALAVAWAADGVRVNAVAPGWIRTGLTAELQERPAATRQIIDRTPMRRWGEASEVAGAVAFLAGPDAGFITGAVLPVDGGYLAT
jgi:NAD(P)-dependent dehydrogenase (short-subunit alcohol dehydrogenase family)